MKSAKGKKASSPGLQKQLSELEEEATQRGIHIHYDLLEAAGIRLKDGICKINGEYHFFIERRKSTTEKMEILQGYLSNPLSEDTASSQ
ncbi:MAG TPA: hypothetical protein DDW42_02625 [Desulfobacteraceae bacterium]|nr:hypothetical protein [Desulfobacteraceae bacterium]